MREISLAEGITAFATRALAVVSDALPDAHLVLRHAALEGELSCGAAIRGGAAIEITTSDAATASVRIETSAPLAEAARVAAETLGVAMLLEIDAAGARIEARSSARKVQLLYAFARTFADAVDVGELADRASLELVRAFGASQVAVHVVRGDALVLVARRLITGEPGLGSATEWFGRISIDERCLQTRALKERVLVHQPLATMPQSARAVLGPTGAKHVIVAPLFLNERAVGTLSIAHTSDQMWPVEELNLLTSATQQLALGLLNASLLEAERRRTRDLEDINQLGSIVSQHLDLPVVLRTVVHRMSAIADVPRVNLLLVNEARTELRTVACSDGEVNDLVLPLSSQSVGAHAFHTRAPVAVNDIATDVRASQTVPSRGARSLLAVPLISRGEPIGALVMVETRHPRRFTKEEQDRLVAVANLVAPAITNAQIFDDLRRSYDALAQAQADLVTHERLAALGELSAVMAHEVRNPLAIIFNSLGSLRRVVEPTGDASLLLDIVGEEAARLNRIVGDLLDFVKPYTSHPRPAQIEQVIRAAVEAACRAAPAMSVRVETAIDAPSAEFVFDAYMLQQALINLIVNAIQAMPKGGVVNVRVTTCAEEPLVRLRCEIDDQGPGINPDDASRIFQPFFTTKASGTGLGLAVVKRIADALSGEVSVAPIESGGARFSLVVPLLEDPPGRSERPA